jgi:hypothetical protein
VSVKLPTERQTQAPALPHNEKRGLILDDPNPSLHPYLARGIAERIGTYTEMLLSDPILAGSVGLIVREISRATWIVEEPHDPTPTEREAGALARKLLGLEGQRAWLRGGLARLVSIMTRNRVAYGFAPFERVWTPREWGESLLMAPSEVYQIPPSTAWGWLWDDETSLLRGLLQVRARGLDPVLGEAALGYSGISRALCSAGLPDTAVLDLALLLDTSGDVDQNPEGRSMLRPCWVYWRAKKDTLTRYQEGQDTLFGGITTLTEQINPKTGRTYSSNSARDLEEFGEVYEDWVDDAVDWLYVPAGFELKSEYPTFQVAGPVKEMEYYDRQEALAFATQLIGIPGSTGMSSSAAQLTFNSIDGIAQAVADTINGQPGIPSTGLLEQLYLANLPGAADPKFRPPRVKPIGIEFQDAQKWIDSLTKASQFLMLHYDVRTEGRIRARLGLPPLTREEREAREAWGQERLAALVNAPVGSMTGGEGGQGRASEEGTQAAKLPPDQQDTTDPDEA